VTELDIAALDDAHAIATLHLVIEREGILRDAAELRQEQAHLAEALPRLEASELAEPDTGATEGDLARTALEHLAQRDAVTRDLVVRAASIPASGNERFDPATLAVGALILLVFRTDFRLERDPTQGWTVKLHTTPLKDSTVGKILSQLLGTYLKR